MIRFTVVLLDGASFVVMATDEAHARMLAMLRTVAEIKEVIRW